MEMRTLPKEFVEELANQVAYCVQSREFKHFMEKMKKEILKGAEVSPENLLRRDYDGISQAEFLVEKMIGECLAEGKVNW